MLAHGSGWLYSDVLRMCGSIGEKYGYEYPYSVGYEVTGTSVFYSSLAGSFKSQTHHTVKVSKINHKGRPILKFCKAIENFYSISLTIS